MPGAHEQAGALDLRRCINPSCSIPYLFPQPEQLADTGIKRHYLPPMQEPATHGLRLGVAGGKEVYLAQTDRSRHIYILGATGCGKSTLLFNMVSAYMAHAYSSVKMNSAQIYNDVKNQTAYAWNMAQFNTLKDYFDYSRYSYLLTDTSENTQNNTHVIESVA